MNLKTIGKVFTSKFVGTGPSSYEKRIYRAAVSQRLRDNVVDDCCVRFRVDRYFIFQNLTIRKRALLGKPTDLREVRKYSPYFMETKSS